MLEGMVPYLKRALLIAIVGCAFFVLFFVNNQLAMAQGGGADSGQAANPPFVNTGNNPGNANAPGYYPGAPGVGNTNVSGNSSTGSGVGANNTNTVASPQTEPQTQTATPPPQVEDSQSCWSSPRGFFHCIMVSFFGTFVAIAGYAFDWSISLFITHFGEMYITYGIGAVVEGTWGTVRDIFNLTFIFGLVYIGFQIILGINESSAKRTIPLLIVAALLVNFSLFIVKFIIDFANLAALQIYNLFTVADTLDKAQGQASPVPLVDMLGQKVFEQETPSIALAFMNTIGVTSLLSYGPGANTAEGVPLFYTFGMIVVFMVLIYVFFAAAILITIRFAVLTFYMIFSPIMFLGWVFPGMKSYSDKFWHGLFGQAFFAPALLFMLYVTYQLSAGLAGPNRVSGAVFKDGATALGFAQFIPYLILIVIFLMASLIIAKKMANQGASAVGKINDWAVNKAGLAAGGMTAGLVARAGRNTVGAGANAMQNSEWGKTLAVRGGRLGKMTYNSVGKVADNSFDARKVGGVGKTLGVGEGRKGGMTTILKENKESDEKFLKAIGTKSADDHDPETKFYKKLVAQYEQELKETTDETKRHEISTALAGAQASYDNAVKKWGPEKEYERQLTYIKSLENWRAVQARGLSVGAMAGAGVLATVATGGFGLGTVAAGLGTGAIGRGSWYNSKQEAAALRKEYGVDGSKKKKADQKKKAQEEAAAALGLKKEEGDHGKKDKPKDDHGKKDNHHEAPKAAAPAPKAAASSSGHDNHAHGGGH